MFVLDTKHGVPDELVSFVRLLLLSGDEWNKTRTKNRLPKPKIDAGVLAVVIKVLAKRLEGYPTALRVSR